MSEENHQTKALKVTSDIHDSKQACMLMADMLNIRCNICKLTCTVRPEFG